MTQAAPAHMPTGSALPVGVPGTSITPKFQVRVRFYRRMKVQRVYRMVVELRPEKGGTAGPSAGDSVIARPVIPGAYVQPAEQELGPKASNSKITFAVTPLARGRLSGARLQIVHQNHVLEEIRTPMRGATQRPTLILGFLTLMALAFLLGVVGPLPNLSTGEEKSVSSALMNSMPEYDEHVPDGLHEYLNKVVVATHLQDGYNYVYSLPNLTFYITAGLFILTLLSLVWNRTKRGRRKGKALILPSLPQQAAGGPLAFASQGRR